MKSDNWLKIQNCAKFKNVIDDIESYVKTFTINDYTLLTTDIDDNTYLNFIANNINSKQTLYGSAPQQGTSAMAVHTDHMHKIDRFDPKSVVHIISTVIFNGCVILSDSFNRNLITLLTDTVQSLTSEETKCNFQDLKNIQDSIMCVYEVQQSGILKKKLSMITSSFAAEFHGRLQILHNEIQKTNEYVD